MAATTTTITHPQYYPPHPLPWERRVGKRRKRGGEWKGEIGRGEGLGGRGEERRGKVKNRREKRGGKRKVKWRTGRRGEERQGGEGRDGEKRGEGQERGGLSCGEEGGVWGKEGRGNSTSSFLDGGTQHLPTAPSDGAAHSYRLLSPIAILAFVLSPCHPFGFSSLILCDLLGGPLHLVDPSQLRTVPCVSHLSIPLAPFTPPRP